MAGIVGLDIGTRAIKAVAMEGSAKRMRVTGFALKELPPGATPEVIAAAVNEALQSLFKGGAGSERVVVALPAYEAAVRDLTLPFVDDARIRSVVKPQAEPLLPFPMEQMILDYVTVGRSEKSSDVVVCAVRKDLVGSTLAMLNGLKVDPVKISLDISGVLNVAAQTGTLPKENAALLVDIGWTATRLALVIDGQVRQIRGFRSGLSSMIGEVAAALDRDAEDAQKVIESFARAEAGLDAAARQAVEQALNAVTDRLQKETKRFLATASGAPALQTVLVTGGGSRLAKVLQALSQVAGAEAVPLDVFAKLPHSLDPATAETAKTLGAAAVGMALEEIGFDQAKINLRQEEFAYRSGFERIRAPLTLCLLVVLLLFGSIGWYMQRRASATVMAAAQTEQAVRDIWRAAGSPTQPIKDLARDLKARLQSIKDAGGTPVDVLSGLELWLEVVKTFPEDQVVVFQNFSITADQCRVQGEAQGGLNSWTAILEAFNRSEKLEARADPIYITLTGGVRFSMRVSRRGAT